MIFRGRQPEDGTDKAAGLSAVRLQLRQPRERGQHRQLQSKKGPAGEGGANERHAAGLRRSYRRNRTVPMMMAHSAAERPIVTASP